MATSENAFQKSEEDFYRPSIMVQQCNDLCRDMPQVGGDVQKAVAVLPRRACPWSPL